MPSLRPFLGALLLCAGTALSAQAAELRLPPGLSARSDGSAELAALALRVQLRRGALDDGSPAWLSGAMPIATLCAGIGIPAPALPTADKTREAGHAEVVNCLAALLPDCGIDWLPAGAGDDGRLAVLDAPPPTANPQLARRAAGFRLVPADAKREKPGLSPDGRWFAALVASGPYRQQLWLHDATTGRVSATLAVPGIDGTWTDATHLRLRGLEAIAVVDAVAGRIVAVEPFHHPAWGDNGYIVQAQALMREASTIPTINTLALLPNGRFMLVGEDQVALIELGSGRIRWRQPLLSRLAGNLCEAMSPDGRWWLTHQHDDYQVMSMADGAQICVLDLAGVELPDRYSFVPAADGASLSLVGSDGVRTTWDRLSGKQVGRLSVAIATTPALQGDDDSRLPPPGDTPTLVAGLRVEACRDGALRAWRQADGHLERTLGRAPIGDARWSEALPDGTVLVHHDRGWAVWDPLRGLIAWVEDGYAPGSAEVDPLHHLVYMISGDLKEVVARRLPSLETVWSWSITPGGAPIAMTMQGAWFAEQDAAWTWCVALGPDRVPLAGFDRALNRPDLVIAALGLASDDDIGAWRQLCERRLGSGPAPPGPGDAARLPRARPGEPVIARASCRLPVRVWGPDPITRLVVRLDGLPWPSQAGIALPTPTRDGSCDLDLPLQPGPNRIEVAAADAGGTVGPATLLNVVGPGEAAPPVLHLVAIGVGSYPGAGADRQLAFPGKDARDLAAALRTSHHARVEVHLLTDAEATAERIAGLHAQLLTSAPGDAVVLFLAGHGALDAAGGYRFMAAGSDLDRPDSGMAWLDLVRLLDGIPARDRIVLIDTCASGGVAAAPVELARGGLRSRGIRAVRGLPSSLPVSAAFLEVEDGLGAQVVAACAADEVSLESTTVANGLFTAALLHGLVDGLPADADRDGLVSTRELAAWAVSEVGRLSGGAQRPNLRSCNPGRGAPVFLPAPAQGPLPPGLSRYAPAAKDPEQVGDAWRAYGVAASMAWGAASVLAADPRLTPERRRAAWEAWLLLYAADAPDSLGDDLLREAARLCLAAGGWPASEPQRLAPSAVPRPAWADEDGADGQGSWCRARCGQARLVFRWCPGGAPPDSYYLNRKPAPAAWIAASVLTVSEALACGIVPDPLWHTDHPAGTVLFSHADRDAALRTLSGLLHTPVVVLPRQAWARAWAAGGRRISKPAYAEVYFDPILPDVLEARPWGLIGAHRREWLVNNDGDKPVLQAACNPWDWPRCQEWADADALGCLRPCILAAEP